jgi:hypothetical protein
MVPRTSRKLLLYYLHLVKGKGEVNYMRYFTGRSPVIGGDTIHWLVIQLSHEEAVSMSRKGI